ALFQIFLDEFSPKLFSLAFKEIKVERRSECLIDLLEFFKAPATPHVIEVVRLFVVPFVDLSVYPVDRGLRVVALLIGTRAERVRVPDKGYFFLKWVGLCREVAVVLRHSPDRLCHMKANVTLIVRAL